MSTGYLISGQVYRILDADGVPVSGGKLYTYAAGTTTPQATYTDATLSTPATNPVVADANGEMTVWLGPYGYKLKETDASGTQLRPPVDGIRGDVLTMQEADDVFNSANRPIQYLETTGTSTAYVLTPGIPFTSYQSGQVIIAKFHTACGANPTINISGLGAVTLKNSYLKNAIGANYIATGAVLMLVRDSSDWFVYPQISVSAAFTFAGSSTAQQYDIASTTLGGVSSLWGVKSSSYNTNMILIAGEDGETGYAITGFGAGTVSYIRANLSNTGIITMTAYAETLATGVILSNTDLDFDVYVYR